MKGVVDNSLKQPFVFKNKGEKEFVEIGGVVTVGDFLKKSNNQIFHFIDDDEKKALKTPVDDLIFRCYQDESYFVDTGNYVGKISWPIHNNKKIELDIGSRFSDIFLQRMMNFANDIYLDDLDDGSLSSANNTAQFILYYLFIQSLEKAYLLGLPKSYESVNYHQSTVKGKVDVNQFIRKDMPFKGKVSSVSRERQEVPEVVDILYRAVSIVIEQYSGLESRVKHIFPHLKQSRSNHFVSSAMIQKAKSSKALQNPMFYPYRKVLDFAEMIIRQQSIQDKNDSNEQGVGFLINVAELFEIYITKLLQKEFPDWSVSSPKLKVYHDQFFSRYIIPDIVMEKLGDEPRDVLVFDTKYKRMNYRGRTNSGMGDVDRTDFFQIHTYMSHYLPTHNVLAAGLLYPLSSAYDAVKCHSPSALGRNETQFVIDGVDVSGFEDSASKANSISNLASKEKEFIGRVEQLIKYNDQTKLICTP